MEYVIREFKQGDEYYIADAHSRIYGEEYNWGPDFISYAQHIAYDYANIKHTSKEGCWIAEIDGNPVGCIMLCTTENESVGQLRLFIVEKECRGHGVGKALTIRLMEAARNARYKKLILWSAAPLKDAIRQYIKLGFVKTETSVNGTWSLSGDIVEEQKFELIL